MTEIELTPEHAADPNSRRVGILVGIVGIFLSVVTIASHRSHTKAVIYRTEANDDWAYYQAKKIRENTSDVAATVLDTLATDPAKAAPSLQKLKAARQNTRTMRSASSPMRRRRRRRPKTRNNAP